ncbi:MULTISPECIES: Zn-ribbon domain-containing OB-fold protein [unclassified Sphingobium]|uniref:Zn-ribbon domain-containing OB-fold protein n=1 Tax=unclassified Sphingobium TaxID=2611147 RepID=UPI000D16698A|nr:MULTISPECIES: OB-fold domain-containing protein [unclassified Sphingobium]MBG6120130.1 putative OB-fold protein [Sphingobium sp. JAI105]PSO12828.1 DNA-binding protein [Sphingobium sp. AEW4]TWD05669.1 hypothetical protein FB595_10929 [Sphingobium sp. AEW010]TWD23222.1 hypothetical protein FB596_10929 [Sphingobium sp. AEW013]TWD25082.1 hypothetical protein FB594_10929 [Sphingobium sp. AEW001]
MTMPEPRADLESDAFYAAAEEGRFLIRRCVACHEAHWHPRALCPFCFGETQWEEASGKGTLYSYTMMGKGDAPQIIAYVTLAEGPTMLTNIVGSAPDRLRIGQAVTLRWEEAGSRKLPCFTVAA